MATPSASYSLTIRVVVPSAPGSFARVAAAIGEAGGDLGAIDLVRAGREGTVRDVTVNASDSDHGKGIVEAVRALPGVDVQSVSDRTFLLHLGGKIEVTAKSPIRTRDDLSMAYTPGVARVCLAIADAPERAWSLTIKRNTVAVVSDGTAVLGLGNIGPEAAMPVMEGKAMLFKEFGGIDAFPLCLATTDVDEIVRTVKAVAPGFGGINLEDISAPRCFEIERRLREELDIPVFHDDQHGTAVVVLAAFLNALRVVGKRPEDVSVVMAGAGAAGIACTKILLAAGVTQIIGADRTGALHRGREGLDETKRWYAENTNPGGFTGTADEALRGADVFIGLSGPGAVSVDAVLGNGRGRDRLRHGESDSGSATGGARRTCRRRRDRTLGLPEPDQQRARVPGHLPRGARRARERDQRGDEARRGRGARVRGDGRRALGRVRDSERLQPRRGLHDRGGRGAGRRRHGRRAP